MGDSTTGFLQAAHRSLEGGLNPFLRHATIHRRACFVRFLDVGVPVCTDPHDHERPATSAQQVLGQRSAYDRSRKAPDCLSVHKRPDCKSNQLKDHPQTCATQHVGFIKTDCLVRFTFLASSASPATFLPQKFVCGHLQTSRRSSPTSLLLPKC